MKGHRELVTERMQKAFDAMRGMTYSEWSKFRRVIERYYESEASERNMNIVLNGFEGLPEMFDRLF